MRIEATAQENLTIGLTACAPQVVSASASAELTVDVEFADGLRGQVKFLPAHLTGVFEPLRDPAFFAQVHVEAGAVTWPGELDLAPDAMYAAIKHAGKWVLQ